ncbi:MAG: metallophosphatase [Vicingaceae bacterium]
MEELNYNKSRRSFVKQIAVSGAGLTLLSACPTILFGKSKQYEKITILHTNDVHSHIEPFPDNDPKYPGLGGVARRAELINQIRKEEENVLLFDSGDIFQGTPYFNYFYGKPELELMSKMQYDCATIGNHDFDNGIDGLNNVLPYASFPFVNVNYDFSKTILDKKISPYKIFIKKGIKIGVYGLGVKLDGLVSPDLYQNTVYYEPVAIAQETEKILKDKGCQLIVCLSHLGYTYKDERISDLKLAEQLKYTQLVLGGHTHTFLDNLVTVKNKFKNVVHINQVGWAGIKLGRIDVLINKISSEKNITAYNTKVSKKQ